MLVYCLTQYKLHGIFLLVSEEGGVLYVRAYFVVVCAVDILVHQGGAAYP